MPLITGFNFRAGDPFEEIEKAFKVALSSTPELGINADEVELAPVIRPEGFHGTVTRINIDLWTRPRLTKSVLQDLATRVGNAFQQVVGRDRPVKVVIAPYDPGTRTS